MNITFTLLKAAMYVHNRPWILQKFQVHMYGKLYYQ